MERRMKTFLNYVYIISPFPTAYAHVFLLTYLMRDVHVVHGTHYGRPERKKPSHLGRKFTTTLKFLGTAKAYFVYHIGPIFRYL